MDTRHVSDEALQAARAALGGDRQQLDLVGTFAIYSMTAILTVVDDSVVAENYVPQLPRPACRPPQRGELGNAAAVSGGCRVTRTL